MADHYKDPYLEKNGQIEEAIAAFHDNKNEDTLSTVLAAFMNVMTQDGHLLIAVDMKDGAPSLKEMQAQGEDPKPLDRDASYVCQTLQTKDGRLFLAGFTSHEELHRGADTDMISDFMKPLFEELLVNEALSGIIINPWGTSFVLTKSMIAVMLGALEGGDET